jgi:MFS family permease
MAETVWIAQLDARERATLTATFAGWMLDGMDVMVYSFVLPTLIVLWHIDGSKAGLLGTSTLLLSAVGGWLAGLLSDRFGRVRVLQITILWFAAFAFLSGFSNSFWQLFALRGLQGLGFGGEWAVGSVLIGETIRSQFRGRAVGTVQSGWAIGWGIAAVCYVYCFAHLPAALAWRTMFWVGILPAFLVFYVRRHVSEPEIFLATHARSAQGRFLEIFSPAMLRVTLLTSLVALGAQGGYYGVTTFLPLYLNQRGLSVLHTGGYLGVIIAGAFAGYLSSAHLCDRLGRRGTLVLFGAGASCIVLIYTLVPIDNHAMLLLGFPLGFFPSGTFSPMGSFFSELFPTSLRGSGQGFAYNLGRGVGALFPSLVGVCSAHMSLGRAIAVFAGGAYLLMALGVWMLPETKGRALTAV